MSLKVRLFMLPFVVMVVPAAGQACHCNLPPKGFASLSNLFAPVGNMAGCPMTVNTSTATTNTSTTMTTNTSITTTTNTTKTMTTNTTGSTTSNATSTTSTNTTTTTSTTTTSTTNTTQSTTTNTTTTTSTSTTNSTSSTTTNATTATSTSNTTKMMTTNTSQTMTTNTTTTMTSNTTSTTSTNTSTSTSTSTTNTTELMTTNTTTVMATNTSKTTTTNRSSTTSTNTSTTTSTTTTNTTTVTTTNTSTTACAEMCRAPRMVPTMNDTMSGDSYTWTPSMRMQSIQLLKTCLVAPIVFGCMPGHRFRAANELKPDMDLITPQAITCRSCASSMRDLSVEAGSVWWSVSWGQFIDGHGESLDARKLFDYYKVLLVDIHNREVMHVTDVPICKTCFTPQMMHTSPGGCCNSEQYSAVYQGMDPTNQHCRGLLHFMIVPCTKSSNSMTPDICLPSGLPTGALQNNQGGNTHYQKLQLELSLGVNQCPAAGDKLVESSLRTALAKTLPTDSNAPDPWSRRISLTYNCAVASSGGFTIIATYTLLVSHSIYAQNPLTYAHAINNHQAGFVFSANTQLRSIMSSVTVQTVTASVQTFTTTNTTTTSTTITPNTNITTVSAMSTAAITTTTTSTGAPIASDSIRKSLSGSLALFFSMVCMASIAVEF